MEIGDKVKVRDDLVINQQYGNQTFAEPMAQYMGRKATIANVYPTGYELDIDPSFMWDELMLRRLPHDNKESGDDSTISFKARQEIREEEEAIRIRIYKNLEKKKREVSSEAKSLTELTAQIEELQKQVADPNITLDDLIKHIVDNFLNKSND